MKFWIGSELGSRGQVSFVPPLGDTTTLADTAVVEEIRDAGADRAERGLAAALQLSVRPA